MSLCKGNTICAGPQGCHSFWGRELAADLTCDIKLTEGLPKVGSWLIISSSKSRRAVFSF